MIGDPKLIWAYGRAISNPLGPLSRYSGDRVVPGYLATQLQQSRRTLASNRVFSPSGVVILHATKLFNIDCIQKK